MEWAPPIQCEHAFPTTRIAYSLFCCYFICAKWTFLFLNPFRDYYRFCFLWVLRYVFLFAWIMASCKSAVGNLNQCAKQRKRHQLYRLKRFGLFIRFCIFFSSRSSKRNRKNCAARTQADDIESFASHYMHEKSAQYLYISVAKQCVVNINELELQS